MSSTNPALPGPIPPTELVPKRLEESLQVCVALAALPPQSSAEKFVAAGVELIARSLDATGGHFGLASRRRPREGDPLQGFRLDVYYNFGPRFAEDLLRADELIQSESYVHDPGIQLTARDAGKHRIYHDPDPRTQPSRAGSIDAHTWESLALVDRLKLVHALTDDLEAHFAFDRDAKSLPFDANDRATLETIMGGLSPWAQRAALLHGCLQGQTLLSARERTLACALLGPEPLKSVADELGIGEARAREIARNVYRKLRVDGRIGLAGAWAGARTETALAPISPLLRRRRR